jgi:hypothetical protein
MIGINNNSAAVVADTGIERYVIACGQIYTV